MPEMNVSIIENGQQKLAEITSDQVLIANVQDALDLMAKPALAGIRKIILHKDNIDPNFFDLRTGLAGEILQKFVNYSIQLAIVGDFENITSESLKAFIIECNRGTQIFFLKDSESAIHTLFSV
jgi:hypothetical protein